MFHASSRLMFLCTIVTSVLDNNGTVYVILENSWENINIIKNMNNVVQHSSLLNKS